MMISQGLAHLTGARSARSSVLVGVAKPSTTPAPSSAATPSMHDKVAQLARSNIRQGLKPSSQRNKPARTPKAAGNGAWATPYNQATIKVICRPRDRHIPPGQPAAACRDHARC